MEGDYSANKAAAVNCDEDLAAACIESYTVQEEPFRLRVATYNILNTSDRYDEREKLLKKNLYELNADIVGLQEVAFGSNQLDELKTPRGKMIRHSIDNTYRRGQGYQVYEAPFQCPEFHSETLLDPRARCDGNVMMVCPTLTHHGAKVVKHEIMHLSAFLNCQRLELELKDHSKVHIVNLHLHDLVEEEQVRVHQIQNVVYWINKRAKPEDLVIMLGDFNALPENDCVSWILNCGGGFRSAYKEYHGEEPEKTYNTGLISPYMDTDPPCTVDYIFYRPGKGMAPDAVKLKYAKVMGDAHDPEDHTIYGSDHYPLVAEFDIQLKPYTVNGAVASGLAASLHLGQQVMHQNHVAMIIE